MEFEDFQTNPPTTPVNPPAQPAAPVAPQAPAAAPASAVESVNARFLALCVAVDAADRGNFSFPLPLQGHDRLTLMARQLQRLFDRVQAAGVAADASDPAGKAEPDPHLSRENNRLKYLIANTPAIIYSSVPTGDGTMTFVSDNALRLLDYKPEDMVADPSFWFDHIHPEDIANIFSSFAQIFTEGQRSYEYRFRTCDGRYLWMHDNLRLIRDAEGKPLEVVGSLTDITERKQMEEALKKKGDEQQLLIKQLQEAQAQLLQSEKMASIGQLAAGIAHEINNPIGFINSNMGSLKNYVDTLCTLVDGLDQSLQSVPAQPELKQKVAQLKQQADYDFLKDDVADLVRESLDGLKRVRDIVQSLRDFAHIGVIDWQYADLHAGLDSTLTIASNEFKYKATVSKDYGQLPPVKCLPSQLNQVFMNLIVNASQAITANGVITVRTGSTDDWVWVEIGDNGAGIAPDILNRIFDPFFTTKPVGKGTGLGLSLSYSIVAKHGGRIEVASELGKGTRFTVHLPVTPPQPDQTS
ncbi:MAG: two component transmembrane sensor histidine kinase [Comamonadaceae bacterium]|nr:MAG: two component transmembrane sensor histidine kinase [Comamonadaceae bacterium]